jgi:hypothetical protein
MLYNWVSKHLYDHGKLTGQIAYNQRLDKYVLLTGRSFAPVNQDFAKKIHEHESRVGRPAMFIEPVKSYTITLPSRIWDTLNKPYSKTIMEVLNARN